MTTVKGVQPGELGTMWHQVLPLIERGLRRGRGFAVDDVRASLEAAQRQLFVTWPDIDCALVTEDVAYPRERVLHVFLLAGRLPADWRRILGRLEAWAAARGCRAIELRGRRGWARKLAGYAQPAVILRKELAA